MITIDYSKLAKAQEFWKDKGFVNIDAPWWCTEEIIKITAPPDSLYYKLSHNGKCLVASGEQAFLYLAAKGLLPDGKFQSSTPCFRFESQDGLHRKGFMKTELIIAGSDNLHDLDEVIDQALSFFSLWLPRSELEVLRTGLMSYDINFRGKELGSYGIRKCDFLTWVYGTGCAEPRLSAIIKNL